MFRRTQNSRDFAEEIKAHLEIEADELRGEGLSEAEAHRRARVNFGSVSVAQERFFLRNRAAWLDNLVRDASFAIRQLVGNPGFTATAVLVMALGIGASIAMFAFVDAALLKPLPYQTPSRLAGVFESSSLCPRCNLSYPDYLDWKKDNRVFSSLEAWGFTNYLWKSGAGVQSVHGVRVSGGFFRTLGVVPVLGRGFTDADDSPSASLTVELTYGTWQNRFGGRQDILGQRVTLDDTAYTVIGVLPREFHFAPRGGAEFWATIHTPTYCEQHRFCHNLFGIARLKDGVSVQAALADMKTIAAHLEKEYPKSNQGQGALVISLSDAIVGDTRPILLVLLSGAGLLLLIACVNVASLLMVRAENRKREMAVREALGASRGRLVRQFVTEAVVLVFLSSALGLAAAYPVIHLPVKLIPEDTLLGMPYLQGVGLHPRVLVFACLVSSLAVAIFSVFPALRLSGSKLREDLAEGGRSASGRTWRRFGSNLVAIELAIAVVLLVGSGLLGKSFYRLLHVDLNFNPDHLATLEIYAPNSSYGTDERKIALSRGIIGGISAMPGVIAVGHTSMLPVTCHCNTTSFRVLGHPWHGEHNDIPFRPVSTDYFKALHARLIRGRLFTQADDRSKPTVVIINQALAKEYFPGEDPIGKKIGDLDLSPDSLTLIVGIVDDIREGGLDQDIRPVLYYSSSQFPDNEFSIAVRTLQDPAPMLPSLVAAIHRIDPNIGVRNEVTMTQRINDSQTAYLHRASACLVGGFAALALLLSVVGLYGVIAYSVSQRTREIGVRMALGAQRGAVYRIILAEAGALTGVGIIAGLGCAIAAATLMRRLLFDIQAWDISTLASVAFVLMACGLLASYLPARRAASMNPVAALRAE